MNDNIFLIYQLKNKEALRYYRFEPMNQLKAAGREVDWANYKHVYTGPLESRSKQDVVDLEMIWMKFNENKPADYAGHSLSVSDVVVIQRDGKSTAYYVDRYTNVEVPEFLEGPYRYYSTQRPVDIGTFPKSDGGPVRITNFPAPECCENASFKAWGFIGYTAPLTQKQIADYELRAASDNPDRDRVSPYQYAAQIRAIGEYEDSKRMKYYKRLTWCHTDIGSYHKYDNVSPVRIAERFAEITAIKARRLSVPKKDGNKKPQRIADQLKAGAEQAARENAERPAPSSGKNHDKGER